MCYNPEIVGRKQGIISASDNKSLKNKQNIILSCFQAAYFMYFNNSKLKIAYIQVNCGHKIEQLPEKLS